jgi:hypothetical protein
VLWLDLVKTIQSNDEVWVKVIFVIVFFVGHQ